MRFLLARFAGSATLALLIGALFEAFPDPAAAGWSPETWKNVPVCTASGNQITPLAVPDNDGGAIVVWGDTRSGNLDLYAQRILSDGTLAWASTGVPVAVGTGTPASVSVAADTRGGCIIAWSEDRSLGTAADIYAQRLSSSGATLWTSNGLVLCNAANAQTTPAIAVISILPRASLAVVWCDQRTDAGDVYGQYVNVLTGATLWASNGVALSTASGNQFDPSVTFDAAGNVLAAWTGNPSGSTYRLRAQKLNSLGVAQWTANGILVTSTAFTQGNPCVAPDLSNGMLIAAEGTVSGFGQGIFAQRISSAGALQWGDGVIVCDATGAQTNPVAFAASTSSFLFAWEDPRSGTASIYAQRTNASGTAQWAADGIRLSGSAGQQLTPRVVYVGGALLACWNEVAGIVSDAYVQMVTTAGTFPWGADGIAATTARSDQTAPTVVTDGAGGAIAIWQDWRTHESYDLYAQRVDSYGVPGAMQPVLAGIRDVRGDDGRRVRVAWEASALDREPAFGIGRYVVYRRLPAAVTWDSIAVVNAAALTGYSIVAGTANDSTGASNPRTGFYVQARDVTGARVWSSTPDSGYSVDDLAPSAPGKLVAEWRGHGVRLEWPASGAADLQGYVVERCRDATFAPGATSTVARTSATTSEDAVASPWYRVVAVDRNGNRSGPSLAHLEGAPAGADDVAPAFAPPAPNPASGQLELRFVVARNGPIRLAAYDVSGRRVRTILAGEATAGPQFAIWDGCDDAGRRLADGIYAIRLETADGARVRVAALVR